MILNEKQIEMYKDCIFLNEEVHKGVISPDKTFFKSITGVEKPVDFGNNRVIEKNVKLFTKNYKVFKSLNKYEKEEINDFLDKIKENRKLSLNDLKLLKIKFYSAKDNEGTFRLFYESPKFKQEEEVFIIKIIVKDNKVIENTSKIHTTGTHFIYE